MTEKTFQFKIVSIGTCLILILFLAWNIWFAAAGFLASDDGFYSEAAIKWMNDGAYVGETHWSLRQTLVLPLSIVYGVLGVSEAALVSVSTAYFLLLLALLTWWLRRKYSLQAAGMFLILAATAPGFVALAGTANVDVIEMFFMALSLILFWEARSRSNIKLLLFLSGLALGLAFLSRATAVALVLSYGVFFIAGAYHQRKRYYVLAAGAFSVFVVDTVYYFIQTGDLLYRLNTMLFSHLRVGNPQAWVTTAGTGNFLEGTALEPIAMLLVNNEFGLIFFAAILLYFLAVRSGKKLVSANEWLIFFYVAIVHFIVVGYLMGLRPLPRYFSFSFLPALLVLSVLLPKFFETRVFWHRILAYSMTFSLVISGLILTDLSDRTPRRAEELLVRLSVKNPGLTMAGDTRICGRASQFLALKNPHGTNAAICAGLTEADIVLVPLDKFNGRRFASAGLAKNYSSFTLATRYPGTPTVSGRVVAWFGLENILPLPKRFYYTNSDIFVFVRRDTAADIKNTLGRGQKGAT